MIKTIPLKNLLLILILLVSVFITSACTSDASDQEANYKLFPTQNYWTFLKLDTRNGKITQVHFSVNQDGARGELNLNNIPLVDVAQEQKGRFDLYPTNNMYNFLLLDRIDGRTWQIQWSFEDDNRGIIAEIK